VHRQLAQRLITDLDIEANRIEALSSAAIISPLWTIGLAGLGFLACFIDLRTLI
jgi:hypothetical protein